MLENVPRFRTFVPVRCYHCFDAGSFSFCGELARWKRPGSAWFEDEYFCNQHRGPSDVIVLGDLVYRRVRCSVDVLLAGVTMKEPQAKTEAFSRLCRAVESIGGVVEHRALTSSVGAWGPAAPAHVPIGWPGGGK